jgi:Spy/CpxP family protein refolding chaperone
MVDEKDTHFVEVPLNNSLPFNKWVGFPSKSLEKEGGTVMDKRALAILSVLALLVMGALATLTGAQDSSGVSAASPVMQSGMSQPSDPSEGLAGRWHHKPSLQAIMKKLGITDDQKKQFRALQVGFRDRTRKTRMELMSLRDEKTTMLLSGKIDQQKLAQIDDQIVKLRSDVMKEALKLRRDRLALLTPEQIERIADWQAEKAFRAKFERRHSGQMDAEARSGE